ncbi:MAG: serine hydrolase [Clostridiales Family XIII bacterium]|jgi:D-alanyl-D-alanine carboxypeptidase (penicillin-binding protein 5/6)|nr:serine hydrolase [Clostridiales Family XIII bacterium]
MSKGYFFSFKKRRGDRTLRWAFLVLAIVAVAVFAFAKVSDVRMEKEMRDTVSQAVAAFEKKANAVKVECEPADALNSASYILLQRTGFSRKFEGRENWVDETDGEGADDAYLHNRIWSAEKPDSRIYPASMVKIITALVVLDGAPDLDREITLTDADFSHYYGDGASIAGFRSGETFSIRDLLYGVLISSGSECTAALAVEVAGGEEAFVERMNAMAKRIGMKDSHFTNPVGLHEKKNYSTVSDIALALDYALYNEDFYEFFTTQTYRTASTASRPEGYELKSTLYQKEGLELEMADGRILGGKTGYTSDAGQCLASYFVKDDVGFLLVTAEAMPDNFRTQALHIDDLLTVYGAIKIDKGE